MNNIEVAAATTARSTRLLESNIDKVIESMRLEEWGRVEKVDPPSPRLRRDGGC
jgi:hypothetical protein